MALTCTVDGFPISPCPGELRHWYSDSAAAEQDVVAFQTADLCHSRVDPWNLAPS